MAQASFRLLARKSRNGWISVVSLVDKELAARARGAAGGIPQVPREFSGMAADLGWPVKMKMYGPPGQDFPRFPEAAG